MLKKIFSSTILFSIGGLLPTMASLVLLLPYTQNLTIADYGALSIYISFTLLLQIIVNFGVDVFIPIHHYEYQDDIVKMRKFVGTILTVVLAISLLSILIMLLSGNFLFEHIFQHKNISFFPFGFMCVVTAVFNAIFKIYTTFLIYRQKPWKFLWFNLFNFVLTVIISLIGLYLYPNTLIGPIWGRLLSGVGIFVLSMYFFISEFGICFDSTMLKGFRKFCVPVLLFGILTWILSYINNYILNATDTISDVGVYDFAIKCTLLIEFSQNGLTSAIAPKIYQMWKDTGITKSTVAENKFHHLFALVTILIVAVNILTLPIIVPILVKKQAYHAAFQYLPLICCGFLFRGIYNLYVFPIYYFKKTHLLPKLVLVSAILQIILGIYLTKTFGIWGAISTTVFIKGTQVIILWFGSRKIFDYHFNIFKMIMMPLLYIVTIIVVYFVFHFDNYWAPGIIQFLFAIIIILIVFRNEIKQVPSLLKTNS
ncbi:MAG: oligosaccharide flippase family protein [Bacteroidia bacterium]